MRIRLGSKKDLKKDEIIERKIIMNNKGIILVMIVVIPLLGSCKSLNSLKRNDELKNAVLNNDLFYSEMLFFLTKEKKQIGYITIFNLRRNLLYDDKYDNCNLDSILSEALKGNHFFNCDELEGCFEPSFSIEKSYKKLSFKFFLEKFTQYLDTLNCFMIRNELTETEKETVAYFLYLNGYYTCYDDYENRYFSTKGIRKPIIEDVELLIE